MKTIFKPRSIAAVVLAAFGIAATVSCSSTTPSRPEARRTAAASSLPDLVSMLSGRFDGTTPGNGLTLDFSTVGARAGSTYDLFLTTSGRYRDSNVRRAGLIRLQTQGRDVYAAYVPHFDPTVTSMSREAVRFSPEELNAACSLYFEPNGDGYIGETRGGVTCAQAMPGSTGKWTVEVDPAGIRVRNVNSGETLRFARRTT